MIKDYKLWTGVGLAAFALASCAPAVNPDSLATDDTPLSAAGLNAHGESGAGEGGGAGESGEGGVDVSTAATDAFVYLQALAVTEAHIRAGIDAHAAGQTRAAGEMFAHPVSEVLADMAPAFASLGVQSMDQTLIEASAAVFANEPTEAIHARGMSILASLDEARGRAPAYSGDMLVLRGRVIADQVGRAARMFVTASASESYEPYLDGYGFASTARAHYAQVRAELLVGKPQAAAAIEMAINLLSVGFPTVSRPERMTGDPAALAAASSQIELSLQ